MILSDGKLFGGLFLVIGLTIGMVISKETHASRRSDRATTADEVLIRLAGVGEVVDAALLDASNVRVVGALASAAARGARVRVYFDAEHASLVDWRADVSHPMHWLVGAGAEVRAKRWGSPLRSIKGYAIGTLLLRTDVPPYSFRSVHDVDVKLNRDATQLSAFRAAFDDAWSRRDNGSIGVDQVAVEKRQSWPQPWLPAVEAAGGR